MPPAHPPPLLRLVRTLVIAALIFGVALAVVGALKWLLR